MPGWDKYEDAILRAHFATMPWGCLKQRLPGRSFRSIENRANRIGLRRSAPIAYGTRKDVKPTGKAPIPLRVIADRDARNAAADLRDLTAAFFGDPAPGYRALDRQAGAR